MSCPIIYLKIKNPQMSTDMEDKKKEFIDEVIDVAGRYGVKNVIIIHDFNEGTHVNSFSVANQNQRTINAFTALSKIIVNIIHGANKSANN